MARQHPNVSRYLQGLQAFNQGRLEEVREVFSDNMVYRVAGKSQLAGEYRGIDQFLELLRRVKALSGGTLTLEPKALLGDEQAIMMYARATARRQGKTLDIDQAYYYRFDDSGKIVEGRTIPVDLYAFDDFWR